MTSGSDVDAWFAAAGSREHELRRVDELVLAAARAGQLGTVSCGKSCIRFSWLDAVDTGALGDLVRDAVAATQAGANGYSAS